jgi:hypothetical protein
VQNSILGSEAKEGGEEVNTTISKNHQVRVQRMKKEYIRGGEMERSIFMCSNLLSSGFWNEQRITECKNKSGVYVISILDEYFKIGSSKNIYNRIISIERGLPFEVQVVKIIETDIYLLLERMIHAEFKHKRIKTEWFRLTPQDIIEMEDFVYALGKTHTTGRPEN